MKKIIPLIILSTLSFSSNAKDFHCKHNALHYATSIEDFEYVNDLLDLNVFILTDYNKQCQTVFNIATETGNVDMLKTLYKYNENIDLKNLENGFGENLLQSALRYEQPESLLFFINKDVNPHQKSSNNLTAYDYQKTYGTDLTLKILEEYDKKADRERINLIIKEKDQILLKMKNELTLKEEKLLLLIKNNKDNPDLLSKIQLLAEEIEKLKIYIEQLETIIFDQNKKLSELQSKNLEKDAIKNKKDKTHLESHIKDDESSKISTPVVPIIPVIPVPLHDFELSQKDSESTVLKNDIIEVKKMDKEHEINDSYEKQKEITNNGELPDISNDSNTNDNNLKIFKILTKPIYKIKEKK